MQVQELSYCIHDYLTVTKRLKHTSGWPQQRQLWLGRASRRLRHASLLLQSFLQNKLVEEPNKDITMAFQKVPASPNNPVF